MCEYQCQVQSSRLCRPPCGLPGEKLVEKACEVRILQCSTFSSGSLSADGIRMHPQHIRQSLGSLPPSL